MARIWGRRVWAIVALGVLPLGAFAVASAVLLPGAGDASAPAERLPQPVRVTAISFGSAERIATYTGTIRPRHEVAMGFRVPGKIVSREVDIGDPVLRGQVLARLDDTDARLQEELAAAEDEAARVDHRRALAEVERSRKLFGEGHIAQAALDRAVSGEAEAASRAERAGRALALARNALAYTRLVADADGVVTSAPGEVGQVVAAGTPVISVARSGALDVVFALPETDRTLLQGAAARGAIWDDSRTDFPLSLRDISPDVDPAGRTYKVRMAMDAAVAGADLGRTVTVTVAKAAGAPVATVPLAAVIDDGAGPGVWRVTGNRVDRVPVEIVSASGQTAAIRGALAEGELVVSLGAHKVDPARPVRVVEHRSAGE
ncbi:MAG: transporter [Rhodobacter sp. CACIA14H1]|nr:MAG: transporter [Rhodobacter sp. CACIA14H1]